MPKPDKCPICGGDTYCWEEKPGVGWRQNKHTQEDYAKLAREMATRRADKLYFLLKYAREEVAVLEISRMSKGPWEMAGGAHRQLSRPSRTPEEMFLRECIAKLEAKLKAAIEEETCQPVI